MPGPAQKPKGQEQSDSARESGQSNDAQPSVREQFQARLMAEREGKPPERKAKPIEKEPVKAQSSEPEDEEDELDPEEEVNDDEELEDPESDPDEEEEEPEEEESDVEALVVGDRRFTVEDVTNLLKQNQEYDADYRRKTQVLARRRQEYLAKGQEYNEIGGFFKQLTEVNLRNLENVDPTNLTQEQFAGWKNQLTAARAGAAQLNQMLDGVRKRVTENREKFLDQQASESADILKTEFKERWGNEFYGKLRDYVVKSGMYDSKEFADITDWRVMKGIVAMYDAGAAREVVRDKTTGADTGKKPTRRQLQRARRDKKTGRFQNTQQAVRASPNAKQDGTLRAHFEARLAQEGGRR